MLSRDGRAELEREFASEAIDTAIREGVTLYLADVREAPNVASTFNQFNLAYEELPIMNLHKGSKIALLVSPDDLSHDFIEILFRNAGYVCQRFVDEDEAIGWLKH